MAIKIGINGFGRIGRLVVRVLEERKAGDIEVVAVNDLTDAGMLAHLFKYDSAHRTFKGHVEAGEGFIAVDDRKIKVLAEKDPAKLPWKALGVDLVLECTGLFTKRDKAQGHIDAGAKKVLISAPATDEDITIIMGVNDEKFDKSKHHVVSCGSCTTNGLAPPASVMLKTFGIKRGMMTTIHSYTNDQALLDLPHRKGDKRRARAGAANLVPTSTGAAKAISLAIPELKGKFSGMCMRAPTIDVSVIDLALETEKPCTKEEINAAMKAAAGSGRLKGIMDYTEVPLVSGDYIGNPFSSIVDGTLTDVMGGNMVKLFAWYDNEWGFSNRMVDLMKLMMQ